MAERPYVSFTEVKQKVSLIDVLEAFGIANSFRPIGKTLTGVCPLPGHAHGPSPNPEQFKINFKGGLYLWHCFGDCQKGGDVVEFVKEMTGFDNTHVRFWFADKFPDRLKLRKGKTSSGSTASPSAPSLPKEKARANACEAIPQRADSEESSTIVSWIARRFVADEIVWGSTEETVSLTITLRQDPRSVPARDREYQHWCSSQWRASSKRCRGGSGEYNRQFVSANLFS